MRTTPLHAGATVADRRLVALLGDGGEGEVWSVVDADGRTSALKLLRPDVMPPGEDVRRRGAWLVRIDHPALVAVSRGGRFTGGALQGWGFVEMALVTGTSLQDAPALPDALEGLADVAEALDLLHDGVWSDGVPLVHRDVKPGNLIDTGAGWVLVDPSTMRGLETTGDLTRVGTPAYVAPEVASGRFGPAADVYSLAATAAALLTGRRGAALAEVVRAPGRHGLPAGVVAGLDRHPDRRPRSCRDVVDPAWTAPDVGVAGGEGWSDQPRRGRGRGRPDTDPGRHGDPDADPAPVRGWALPVLAVLAGVPAVAHAVDPAGRRGVAVLALAAAAVCHVLVHAVTGRTLVAVAAPPWAWGRLLAEGRHRASWLADVVAGALLLVGVAVGWAVVAGAPRWAPAAGVVVGLLVVSLAIAQARTRGRVRWALAWVVWLPLRVVGGVPALLMGGRRSDLP